MPGLQPRGTCARTVGLSAILSSKLPTLRRSAKHSMSVCRRLRHMWAFLGPKHVAYTIFPHRLHAKCGTAAKLYNAYNRPKGLCERVVRRANNHWGTYFQRITAYPTSNGPVNQLDKIITAIRSDPNTFSAAFAMVIQKPGGETTRRLGGPCLNYVAVQLDAGPPLTLGLLCTYRNHDFLERAYGNYWGLSNLLRFMANETAHSLDRLPAFHPERSWTSTRARSRPCWILCREAARAAIHAPRNET